MSLDDKLKIERKRQYDQEYYQRTKAERMPDYIANASKHQKLSPAKYKARYMVRNHVRLGKITKEPCFCGEIKVEAHHYLGYHPEYWFGIKWYCKKHHMEAHRVRQTA